MEAPPLVGDPYELVPPGVRNPGSQGVLVAWDGFRHFYGRVLAQSWGDLTAAIERTTAT